MIELRTLRNLVTVADVGTVAGAAEQMHIGQPALSRQISQAERTLGFAVFERTPRGMVLTPAGRPFIKHARELLHHARNLEDLARRIAGGESVSLQIAAPVVTITDVLAPFIAAGEHVRDVDLDLIPANGSLPYRLLGTEADIAISSSSPTADLEWRVLAEIPMTAQVPQGHRFVGRESITLAELAEERLLLRQEGHQIRMVTDRAFAREGLDLRGYRECEIPSLAQALAAKGQGVAVLSEAPTFNLTALRLESTSGPIVVPIYAAWRPNHFARDTIVEILDEIASYYSEFWNKQFGT